MAFSGTLLGLVGALATNLMRGNLVRFPLIGALTGRWPLLSGPATVRPGSARLLSFPGDGTCLFDAPRDIGVFQGCCAAAGLSPAAHATLMRRRPEPAKLPGFA